MELIKVEGNEYYYATRCGKIYSKAQKKIRLRKPYLKKGYEKLNLNLNGGIKTFYVHRLIGLTFIPNPENKPEINHINGIPSDNKIENLEWCTKAENRAHAIKEGLYPKRCMPKKIFQLDLKNNVVKRWKSIYEAGMNGYSEKAISSCLHGRIKTHKGYKWEYPKKIDSKAVCNAPLNSGRESTQ